MRTRRQLITNLLTMTLSAMVGLLLLAAVSSVVTVEPAAAVPNPTTVEAEPQWTLVDSINEDSPPIDSSSGSDGGNGQDGAPGPGELNPADEDSGQDGDIDENGNPIDGGSGDSNGEGAGEDTGGLITMSMPGQIGLSLGLVLVAFLALLVGRRMPENLR